MEKDTKDYAQIISQIGKTANSNLPLKNILNSIIRSSAKAIEAAGGTIMLLSPQKEYLTVLAAQGLSDIFLRKGALNVHKSLPEVMEGKIAQIVDVAKDKRAQYPEAAAMEKLKSIIGIPLIQKGEIIGELRFYTQELKRFSPTEKHFLSAISNIVSLSMERHKLYQLLDDNDYSELTKISRKKLKIPKLSPAFIRPTNFGHPSEEQFARLLDFYKIEWLYEPRSFPLQWRGSSVAEMFTPDFYLPELDLYVELTTMKQSLATDKNRKIRRMKELFPDINIKLLNKSDYLKLLVKYGYGPIDLNKIEGIGEVLFNHSQIQHRISTLAYKISQDYAGKKLVLVGVLKGVICFMSDLMRNITLPLSVEFMAVSYYGTGVDHTVKVTKDLDINIAGLHVLMVEDIVDTGMTLNYILNHLSSYGPASLKVCTLLDKRVRRLVDVPLDYIGFEIPDEFVVGYGLDYRSEYRNLPFIGVLNTKSIDNPEEK